MRAEPPIRRPKLTAGSAAQESVRAFPSKILVVLIIVVTIAFGLATFGVQPLIQFPFLGGPANCGDRTNLTLSPGGWGLVGAPGQDTRNGGSWKGKLYPGGYTEADHTACFRSLRLVIQDPQGTALAEMSLSGLSPIARTERSEPANVYLTQEPSVGFAGAVFDPNPGTIDSPFQARQVRGAVFQDESQIVTIQGGRLALSDYTVGGSGDGFIVYVFRSWNDDTNPEVPEGAVVQVWLGPEYVGEMKL